MSYVLSFTFFGAAYFHLALVAASISHFVTAATKNGVTPLFLFPRSRLCRPLSR